MGSTIIEQDFPYDILRRGERDQRRHNKKVEDAARKQLKDIISQQDIITSEGNKKVKVRLKYLDQYRFIYNRDRQDHIGRDQFDELDEGEVLQRPEAGQGGDGPKAGNEAGDELFEAEFTIEELTKMMMEELELPDLDESKKNEIISDILEYTDRRKSQGVYACIDKKKTILANITRKAKQGKGPEEKVPIVKDDLRFRTWDVTQERHSNAVIFLMMDRSGCHTAGHLVETPIGWKTIESIKVGDFVRSLDIGTGDRHDRRVKNVFKYTVPKTLVIRTEDGELRCTPNHRYFVYECGKIIEKTSSELNSGDYLIRSFAHVVTKKICRKRVPKQFDPDECYLAGFALGDGNVYDSRHKKGGSVYLQITDKNTDRLSLLQEVCKRVYNKTAICKLGSRNRLHINSHKIVDRLLDLNPYLVSKSPVRRLSNTVCQLPQRELACYLVGLFDAEGFVSDHAVSMVLSSKRLILDIKTVLAKFDIRGRVYYKKVPERHVGSHIIPAGVYYQLSINSKDCIKFAEHIGFACKEKNAKLQMLVDKQLAKKNAMRSKYVSFRDVTKMSTSYAREKAGLYSSGIDGCYSHSSLASLLSHDDTNEEEREYLKSVLENSIVLSKVTKVDTLMECVDVYDLEVDKEHNYFVDGILSHNSMWRDKIYAVKALYFWIVRFLRLKYDRVEIKFIAHDYVARELDEREFFTISDSGGTKVSSAYELCREMIEHNYPDDMWNIYCFHASDGDTWGEHDVRRCLEVVKEIIGLGATMFAYSEINIDAWREGDSDLMHYFRDAMDDHPEILVSSINDTGDIFDTLKTFLQHSTRSAYQSA